MAHWDKPYASLVSHSSCTPQIPPPIHWDPSKGAGDAWPGNEASHVQPPISLLHVHVLLPRKINNNNYIIIMVHVYSELLCGLQYAFQGACTSWDLVKGPA